MSVFVDSSAIYAFLVEDDPNHQRSSATLDKLERSGHELTTHEFVLLESTALLQRRHGLAAVRALRNGLLQIIRVERLPASLSMRALDRLIQLDRRSLSLVDLVSFEWMRRNGLRWYWAYDEDFRSEGFEPFD